MMQAIIKAMLVITLLTASSRGYVATLDLDLSKTGSTNTSTQLSKEQQVEEFKSQMNLDRNYVLNINKIDAKIYCMALNNFYEAGSEPFLGKIAVSEVVQNRAESGSYPNDVCRVIKQVTEVTKTQNIDGKEVKGISKVCQFSWYCERSYPLHPIRERSGSINQKLYDMWHDSVVAAILVLEGNIPSLVDGATHFYPHKTIRPSWSKRLVKTDVIGNHTFMKNKED